MRRLLVLLVAVACLSAVAPLAPAGAAGPLDDVTVTGGPAEKPVVSFDAPFKVKSSTSDVRTEGSGTRAERGSQVLIDYVILNGRDGQEIETSYGAAPATLSLTGQSTKAIVDALVGTSPGSRVVVAVAPKDGLAQNGAAAGIRPNDTLLFVVDVREVTPVLERATGTAVDPPDGLPAVTLSKKGKPKIAMPDAEPPADLVAQTLIRGDGPVVEAGQAINVHYTGALYRNGKVFDSSWQRGEPVQFPIGTGSVIAGWDQGLVGQTVGSQVLLVIPPAQGYGPSGQPAAGIRGTDTLVFVVDILAAT